MIERVAFHLSAEARWQRRERTRAWRRTAPTSTPPAAPPTRVKNPWRRRRWSRSWRREPKRPALSNQRTKTNLDAFLASPPSGLVWARPSAEALAKADVRASTKDDARLKQTW